jgi:hypothetical protein
MRHEFRRDSPGFESRARVSNRPIVRSVLPRIAVISANEKPEKNFRSIPEFQRTTVSPVSYVQSSRNFHILRCGKIRVTAKERIGNVSSL